MFSVWSLREDGAADAASPLTAEPEVFFAPFLGAVVRSETFFGARLALAEVVDDLDMSESECVNCHVGREKGTGIRPEADLC